MFQFGSGQVSSRAVAAAISGFAEQLVHEFAQRVIQAVQQSVVRQPTVCLH